MTDRIDRHHLLEIILWPNPDGTFREIRNSRARLKELGIYDDWKMCIEIPRSQHISLHHKGKINSESTKRKISEGHLGKKLSEEHKQKLSVSGKGKVRSLETRKKIAAFHIGLKASDETRKKLSLSHSGENNPMWKGDNATEASKRKRARREMRRAQSRMKDA